MYNLMLINPFLVYWDTFWKTFFGLNEKIAPFVPPHDPGGGERRQRPDAHRGAVFASFVEI